MFRTNVSDNWLGSEYTYMISLTCRSLAQRAKQSFAESQEFHRTFNINLFKKICDMTLEKFWYAIKSFSKM